MKARLNQAIDITLKPSLLLLGVLSCIAIVSCVILAILPIPYWIKLLLLIFVLFSTIYVILRDCLLLLPWSWHHIGVTSFGELKLINKQGQQFMPSLHPTSLVHPLCIILNLTNSTSNRRIFNHLPVLILPTQQCKEQHRQLRVWLRWWEHKSN